MAKAKATAAPIETPTTPDADVFIVPVPKESGTVAIDMTRVPPHIIMMAARRGLADKMRDLAANAYTREKRSVETERPGDVVFDSHTLLTAHLRRKATELRDRWYDGEWALDGGSDGDPVRVECFRRVREFAVNAGLDPKGIHKDGFDAAVRRIVVASVPGETPNATIDAMVKKNVAAIMASAKEAVAARAKLGGLDLTV